MTRSQITELLIFISICCLLVSPILFAGLVSAKPDMRSIAVETRGRPGFSPYQIQTPPPSAMMTAEISYYTNAKEETDQDNCRTADMTWICPAKENIIAANWLTFGTLVNIDGKVYRVADRMARRNGYPKIDLLVSSREEAIKRGREIKNVLIY